MKRILLVVLSLLFVSSGPVFADQDHEKGRDKDHDKALTDKDRDRDRDGQGGSGGAGGAGGSGGNGGSATGGAGGSATANGGNATANGGNATANGTVNSSNKNTANGGSVTNSGNSSNRNSNSQSQSQSQTANGGNVSGSGNSTAKNTSTNNNTVTGAYGGAGGQGGAGGNATATSTAAGGAGGSATGGTQSQSASANGNDFLYNSTTNVEAPKIPVATAYSPTAIPTVPCFKGIGAGVQTAPFGASFGGGKVDENCAILETARSFALSGSRLAYCKTMLINKYAKKAGVTLADCLRDVAPPATATPTPSATPTPLAVAPQIVVAAPAPVAVPAPTVAIPVSNFTPQLVGICTFASNFECNLTTKIASDATRVTTICDQMIAQAIKLVKANPGTVIKLIGNENSRERNATNMYALARAKNVQRKFLAAGIAESSTVVVTGGSGDRTVEVWVVPASA